LPRGQGRTAGKEQRRKARPKKFSHGFLRGNYTMICGTLVLFNKQRRVSLAQLFEKARDQGEEHEEHAGE
jgi:hypothetical protein